MTRMLRYGLLLVLLPGLILSLVVAVFGWLSYRSLPLVEGELDVEGLQAVVEVRRDKRGRVSIVAENRLDLAFATGFVHGQERFFQMDLLRRGAAGELAALLGGRFVEADTRQRVHRFRAVAQEALAEATPTQQEVLRNYARGVNAGLMALRGVPPEYLVLGTAPQPWSAEDSFLVICAMYVDLQAFLFRRDASMTLMKRFLPEQVVAFLAPLRDEWDVLVTGEAGGAAPVVIPGAGVFDLRGRSAETLAAIVEGYDWEQESVAAASNSWAITGPRTETGAAVLANDMHLGLAMPNIWHFVQLQWQGEHGRRRRVVGVALPGTPYVVAGSNGDVAWGFTNSHVDSSDLVVIETIPGDPSRYWTPFGTLSIDAVEETVEVRGEEPRHIQIQETFWGPVYDRNDQGRLRVLRWVAHDPAAVNVNLGRLEQAAGVDEALRWAPQFGIPAQNMVVADRHGNIAWTIAGRIPRRSGLEGRTEVDWADADHLWSGWLVPQNYPRLKNPEGHLLVTANNRLVDGAQLAQLGDGGYSLGSRARQIADTLRQAAGATIADQVAIQLDDRAVFLKRWRNLLLRVLTDEIVRQDKRRRLFRDLVRQWGGHASTDSVGYRLVRGFRLLLAQAVFGFATRDLKKRDPQFDFNAFINWESALWRLVSEQPLHWLNPQYGSWQEQMVAVVDLMITQLTAGGIALESQTWGKWNRLHMRHPFSHFIPGIGRWLDIPPQAMPGGKHLPRVQLRNHGASQRLVVSPGHEEHGVLQLPGGESGHFLSPSYRSEHTDWQNGGSAPLLVTDAVAVLVLRPQSVAAVRTLRRR